MQTISTRFLGPTNTRGARVVARTSSGHRLTTPWQHSLNLEQNHTLAAWKLARKLDWIGPENPREDWIGGESPDGRGLTFVCAVGWAPRLTAEPPDFLERRVAG